MFGTSKEIKSFYSARTISLVIVAEAVKEARSRSRLRRGLTRRRQGPGPGPHAADSCSLVRHRCRDRAAEGLRITNQLPGSSLDDIACRPGDNWPMESGRGQEDDTKFGSLVA
jgi:hypothetical protein